MHHLMTRPDTSPVTLPTDHHLLPLYWTLPSALPSAHQTARAEQPPPPPPPTPQTPEKKTCSIVPCTGKPEASSDTRKLRCRRSYIWSLKKHFTSSCPQTSRSEVFSHRNAEEEVPTSIHPFPYCSCPVTDDVSLSVLPVQVNRNHQRHKKKRCLPLQWR